MTLAPSHPAATDLPAPLRERLGELGVTLLHVAPDGRAQIQQNGAWIARLLVQAPSFRVSLRRAWDQLLERPDTPVTLWPGVWLVGLPSRRRRRLGAAHDRSPVSAVLLVGAELLESEQFRAVCDNHELDYRATAARVAHDRLVSSAEVHRLAQMIAWMHEDAAQLNRHMDELKSLSTELGEAYEELSLLYKLSGSMIVNQPAEQFLTNACGELQQVVGVSWMALLLADEPRLEELCDQLFLAGPVAHETHTMRAIGQQIMECIGERREPMVVDDTRELAVEGLSEIADDLIVIPLRSEKQRLGILFGSNKLDGATLTSVDSKLCDSLANSLTIFLENRMLYDDMQAMFLGTLHALTSAIDAKDSYTHGHSERVALMGRKLAEAAGLDTHTCERVYIAGLVHDVGKIGVPERVLCKPGKLTAREFDLVKMHPEIGGRILQDIRQMEDLLPGVLYHHERWDGAGYPQGLAGEDIPLFGRLLGLADAFDAMSSDRTYRAAMQFDHVIAEVRRHAGTQFDPQLAELFVNLDFQPFFDLIQKHQQNKLRRPA
ncbi:MAG: HD-GYP domain-containing protein [Phycisphaeraceae bacterium]